MVTGAVESRALRSTLTTVTRHRILLQFNAFDNEVFLILRIDKVRFFGSIRTLYISTGSVGSHTDITLRVEVLDVERTIISFFVSLNIPYILSIIKAHSLLTFGTFLRSIPLFTIAPVQTGTVIISTIVFITA